MSTAYRDSYPRGGDVALLCEGDLVGYEASILRRWTDQRLRGRPLVDIWPCGTAGSIFGVSDAIGRARPLMVIEDRDFRSETEAVKDCQTGKKDRERRDVRVLGWRTWRRNEIENYLLEPEVSISVLAEVFGCTHDDVQNGLSLIIRAQSVPQAAQYALYRARRLWNKSDPAPILPSNLEFRPTWDDDSGKMQAPDPSSVKTGLQQNVGRWAGQFVSDGGAPPDMAKDVVRNFETKYEEWQSVDWDSATWRLDWAGKEILQWLRVYLTSRYGWWDRTSGGRVKLKWTGLTRAKREAQDRPLEADLRPPLVASFLDYLSDLKEGNVFDEWMAMENELRS